MIWGATSRCPAWRLHTEQWVISKKPSIGFEKAIAEGDGDAALDLAKLYMVSDLESANVKKYLILAKNSRNVVESYRIEAERLLNEIDN